MKQEIDKGIKRSIAWTAEFTFGFWLEKIKKYNVKYQNNIEFNKISDMKPVTLLKQRTFQRGYVICYHML